MSPQAAAAACGASRATGYRLWRRYREGGWAGAARSAADAERCSRAGSRAEVEAADPGCALTHWLGPARLAALLGRPASTVGKVLRRGGCSRLPRPPPWPRVRPLRARPAGRADARRHQEARPLLAARQTHPRGRRATAPAAPAGSTCTSRSTTTPAWPTPSCSPARAPADCAAFLRRAVAWYAEHGITIERVLTDNGNGYRSHAWRDACAELGIHAATPGRAARRPTAKPKRSIKTLLREWAYRFTYPTSSHRARALPGYLRWYNTRRPHGSLGAPPISRVSQLWGPTSSRRPPGNAATGARASGTATDTVEQITERGRSYGQIQVEATVENGTITDVGMVQISPTDGRSASIDDYAVPQLVQETLAAGTAKIDAVSGETYTSEAYAASLQAALRRGRSRERLAAGGRRGLPGPRGARGQPEVAGRGGERWRSRRPSPRTALDSDATPSPLAIRSRRTGPAARPAAARRCSRRSPPAPSPPTRAAIP